MLMLCYQVLDLHFNTSVGMNLKALRLKGGSGVVPSAGIQGVESLGGGQGAKPPEASAFSKMRLEFVQQVHGTIIT